MSNGSASPTTNLTSLEGKELIESIPIKTTPFTAVRVDEKWHLVMGKYRLVPDLESLEDCELAAFNTSWDMILNVIAIMIEEYKVTERNEKEIEDLRIRVEKKQKEMTN